jgi:L-2-hydroxycarboxylate dehydrogenase (NAD+)
MYYNRLLRRVKPASGEESEWRMAEGRRPGRHSLFGIRGSRRLEGSLTRPRRCGELSASLEEAMAEWIVPAETHDWVVTAAYKRRGYAVKEAAAAAYVARLAAWHGIKTHNAIKALHLDELFGSKAGGCVPRAKVEKLKGPWRAIQRWNANRKLGQAVALEAMAEAMKLADRFGIGAVAVDNAFHYLWGGGYVIEAAKKGYVAYTCCTASLAEVVPFGGKFPTLGTNPHSWAFPTTEAVGFPVCVDWATSVIAFGRVEQYKREGKPLPPGAAVDADGHETTDPSKVKALLPFGAHKGYGLSLIDELLAALIGGSLPTLRSRWAEGPPDEKRTPCFFFQAVKPEALGCGAFAQGRSQAANVKAVLEDVLGHGNTPGCLLPGEVEHRAAVRSGKAGGLLFTDAEVAELEKLAKEARVRFDRASLRPAPPA